VAVLLYDLYDLSVDDQTRVKLKALSNDYINANYVNVRLCYGEICYW